jgi:CBS domain-containing protein
MAERVLVRDLMSVGVASCALQTPISDIARLLLDKDLEAVVVMNAEGHAVGIVSQDELARAYAREDRARLTAEDVMRDGVPEVPPDIPIVAAAQIMRDQGLRVVFLMHHAGGIRYPAASLSYRHLLRHLAARDDGDLTDLGIKAAREAPLQTFIQKREAARRRSGFSDQE